MVSDPAVTTSFLQLQSALASSITRLERDERLTEWLRALTERSSAVRAAPSPISRRDDKALRLAYDCLGDQPEHNVGLDELATAAGVGKFRLIRLFRERTGLPPHALRVARRIRAARILLESGETIAATAAATGFATRATYTVTFNAASE